LKRDQIFERDRYRCVYCGQVYPVEELTVDHVQPRSRGGDRSAGNLVTACMGCNTRKGRQRLATFLAANVDARRNFFRYATAVWPRHLRAVEEQIVGRLASDAGSGGCQTSGAERRGRRER
jgi:5-methylcytosine-specific restriction endonuclease McrA